MLFADHRRIEQALGADGLWGLFNNAGIVTSGTAETTSDEVWNETMLVNVTAVWRMSRLVIPVMKAQGGGVIVNNGSDWSVVAGKNAFPYVVSKGAVGLMTKAMALDYASENIRVNAVCPGFIESESLAHFSDEERAAARAQIPMRRFGRPEEVAAAVTTLFLEGTKWERGEIDISQSLPLSATNMPYLLSPSRTARACCARRSTWRTRT